MAKGFWDDYNKEQKKIMEQREQANKGKIHKKPSGPLVGNWTFDGSNKKPSAKKK